MGDSWTLAAVGDVFLNHENNVDAFEFVQPIFDASDIVFGNCEGAYASRLGTTPTASGFSLIATPDRASLLRTAGFNVMSLANNHAVDASHDGLTETVRTLADMDISTVGAGENIAAARKPAFIHAAGRKVGFLAFASVFPAGYEARATVPGIAAMRAHTHYFIHPEAFGRVEPGADPSVHTFPFREDLAALEGLITSAGAECDTLAVSFHWGKSIRPAELMDYEFSYGRAAIDFGADIILGHHHHLLRAVEVYKGKPIFYGLSHFAFDMAGLEQALGPQRIETLKKSGDYAIYPRAGYPLLPFHPDARMTAIAVCVFNEASCTNRYLIPCMINEKNQPVPVDVASSEGEKMTRYMADITNQVGLKTGYRKSDRATGGFRMLEITESSS
ncbi:MAG: CapA family protein [Alphaproteobacteria bacterium]|nr:CapA family protein [Alphaproteobacteria bacterium]